MVEPARPRVSVVIPVYNGADVIARQVRAVASQLREGDEMVVANNRSTDGTGRILHQLAAELAQLRVVEAPERAGVNYARNTGVRSAVNPYVLLCDADDRVGDGWVEALAAGLAHHDMVGGLSRLCDAEGMATEERRLERIFSHLPYALGCNLGVRRRVFETVGCFDESFLGGHDEVDFSWRAQHAGYTLGFIEGAVIDYVQRPDPHAVARQYRHYGRTSIQLWVRHREWIPAGQISTRGALLSLLRNAGSGLRVVRGVADQEESRAWGWARGVLEGHIRYRLLRGMPESRVLSL